MAVVYFFVDLVGCENTLQDVSGLCKEHERGNKAEPRKRENGSERKKGRKKNSER